MKRVAWLVCLFCLLLVACGSAPAKAVSGAQPGGGGSATLSGNGPTLLQVTRSDLAATNSLGPLDRTITKLSTVQNIYRAALALPAYSNGTSISQACLNNVGVVYHLAFSWSQAKTQIMDLQPGSCQVLSLTQTDMRQVNVAFLKLVAQAIQVKSLTSNN